MAEMCRCGTATGTASGSGSAGGHWLVRFVRHGFDGQTTPFGAYVCGRMKLSTTKARETLYSPSPQFCLNLEMHRRNVHIMRLLSRRFCCRRVYSPERRFSVGICIRNVAGVYCDVPCTKLVCSLKNKGLFWFVH